MKIVLALGIFLNLSALAMPAQVLIIRHAEKPDPEGTELSEKGWKRAHALVGYFKNHPDVTEFGPPVSIYAMKPKDETGSVRPIQTVTPLAESLGIPVQSPFKKDGLKELVNQVNQDSKNNGRTVLICWEHKLLPDMAVEFGVKNRPAKWPGEDYSTVYKISFKKNQEPQLMVLTEQVGPLYR